MPTAVATQLLGIAGLSIEVSSPRMQVRTRLLASEGHTSTSGGACAASSATASRLAAALGAAGCSSCAPAVGATQPSTDGPLVPRGCRNRSYGFKGDAPPSPPSPTERLFGLDASLLAAGVGAALEAAFATKNFA